MHESSLALSVLDIVRQEAETHHARRITRITLGVGPFTGLEWETFRMFFELAAQGTVAETAELVRVSAPAQAICRACGHDFGLHHIRDRCPQCASNDFDCMGGRTFTINGLEGSEEA